MESTLLLTTPLELAMTAELEAGTLVALEEPAREVDGVAADDDDPATEVPALVADDETPAEEAEDPDVAPAEDASDDDDAAALLASVLLEPEPPVPEEDAPDAEVPALEEPDAAALEPARDDDNDTAAEDPDTVLLAPVLLAPVLLAGPPVLELEVSATRHCPVSGSQLSPASHGTPGHSRPQVPLPWHTRPCAQSSCAVQV